MKFDKYEKNGAYHWDWYNDPNYAWYKVCVDRVLRFCEGSTLDLGCGEGVVGSLLLGKGVQDYLGYDIDHTAVQLADPDLDVRHSDICEPADWQLDYEYLVCLNTIEHLKSPGVVPFIFDRCISKAGIIITDKPTGDLGRYHVHEFTKQELLDLFKDFNPKYFEIKSTEHGKPITFHGVEIKK